MAETIRRLLSSFQRTRVHLRSLSATPTFMYPRSVDDLEKAKKRVTTLSQDPGNEAKLKLYGLFKQV